MFEDLATIMYYFNKLRDQLNYFKDNIPLEALDIHEYSFLMNQLSMIYFNHGLIYRARTIQENAIAMPANTEKKDVLKAISVKIVQLFKMFQYDEPNERGGTRHKTILGDIAHYFIASMNDRLKFPTATSTTTIIEKSAPPVEATMTTKYQRNAIDLYRSRPGGFWKILVGALSAGTAATTGYYAYKERKNARTIQ